ncbi:hypothetical protein FF38_03822, partial [Lucilia cuprina]
NWQPIISSSLASLLLLGISTLIAIALVIHSELVPKKLLHVNNKSTNATNSTTISTAANTTTINTLVPPGGGEVRPVAIQEQELDTTTTLLHSANMETTGKPAEATGQQTLRQTLKPPLRFVQTATTAAGVRGAIGISWLLPLLFAITSPLICTINGKWPQNWWLEIMSHSTNTAANTQANLNSGGSAFSINSATNSFLPLNERYIRTHLTPFTTEPPLLSNGDSVLEFNTTTALDNSHLNVQQTTTKTTTSSGNTIDATSTIWSQTARSPVTFQHNDDIGTTFGIVNNLPDTGLMTPAVPALNFILFLFVDILFILLFFALFAILIKKLLWLWHKNRRTNNATSTGTASSGAATPATTNQQQQQHSHHHYQQQQQQQLSFNGNNSAALDKFNMVMKQRIGLLYRTGCLLLIKLCTDALFIVYSNSMVMETTWWCYPFGISCILM